VRNELCEIKTLVETTAIVTPYGIDKSQEKRKLLQGKRIKSYGKLFCVLSLEKNLQQVQTGKATQPGYVGNGSTIPTGKEDHSEVTAPLLMSTLTEPNEEE
jgi:hypothetical protein